MQVTRTQKANVVVTVFGAICSCFAPFVGTVGSQVLSVLAAFCNAVVIVQTVLIDASGAREAQRQQRLAVRHEIGVVLPEAMAAQVRLNEVEVRAAAAGIGALMPE
jgi:hypothetical protein